MATTYANLKYSPKGEDTRTYRYMPPQFQESFKNFAYWYWYTYRKKTLTVLQLEFCEWLQHGWGDPSQPRLCLAYRGFGKTSILGQFQAWWLEQYPWEQVLFVGNSEAHTKAMGARILNLIDNVPQLQGLRATGDKVKSHSQKEFDVAGSPLDAPRSWSSVTYGVRELTGMRAGLTLMDDWETASEKDSMASLKAQIRAATEIWNVQSEWKPHWTKIATGTYHNENGFWTQFQAGDFNVRARIYPACYPDPEEDNEDYLKKISPLVMNGLKSDPTLVGKPCDRLGEKALSTKIGGPKSKNFRYQYMLDNTTGEDEAYPLKCSDFIVEKLDANKLPENLVWGTIKPSKLDYLICPGRGNDAFFRSREGIDVEYGPPETKVMYVDTAGRGRDEMVWVYATSRKGRIFILDFHAYRRDQAEVRWDLTAKAVQRHGVHKVMLETNNNNSAVDLMTRACRDLQVNVAIEGTHNFHRKERRILPLLDSLMSQHLIVVDEDVIRKDQRLAMGDLSRQMFHQIAYARDAPSLGLQFDDRIDALAGACKMLSAAVRYSPVPEQVNAENIEAKMHQLMVDEMIRKHKKAEEPVTSRRFLNRRSSALQYFRR